jgi:hypothetical protein
MVKKILLPGLILSSTTGKAAYSGANHVDEVLAYVYVISALLFIVVLLEAPRMLRKWREWRNAKRALRRERQAAALHSEENHYFAPAVNTR